MPNSKIALNTHAKFAERCFRTLIYSGIRCRLSTTVWRNSPKIVYHLRPDFSLPLSTIGGAFSAPNGACTRELGAEQRVLLRRQIEEQPHEGAAAHEQAEDNRHHGP